MTEAAERGERLARMRQEYEGAGLEEADLAATWLEQFSRWLDEAESAGVLEPNAMVVATADAGGSPTARTVLLKGLDDRGFAFFTNLDSLKARQADANPRAALVFPWIDLHRQVMAAGPVEPVSDDEADAYFELRPRGAQISALASPQSQVVESRAEIERLHDEAEAELAPGRPVPRPPHWGGLRVVPVYVEFWQGRPDRLHDRLRFRRAEDGGWVVERLAP
jgi:pyridoxamine 5'-phosphate oxidase